MSNYDIIGLQETKTDISDTIDVPGFVVHLYNRQNLSRYRSGGIAVLVKDCIAKHVKVDTNSKSNLIKWLTISKTLYGSKNAFLDEDLKCGIVYIPPMGSKYAHAEPFFEVQNELLRYCTENKHILLMGDFNARCGIKVDFVKVDNTLVDVHDMQDIQQEETSIFQNFELYEIPLHRKSVDTFVNSYGQELIDMCKNNSFFSMEWKTRL